MISPKLHEMRNLIRQMTCEPKIIMWLVFFFFAYILTVIPVLGPAFLGYIVYRIRIMGEVKRMADVTLPTLLGVIAHCLLFYLPSWPFGNYVSEILTLINLLSLAVVSSWEKIFSIRLNKNKKSS